MLVVQRADALRVWAPAKVNLFLEVLRKRPDGYHEIDTALVAVNLFDTLDIREDRSGHITLACSEPGLRADATNLVVRAAELLRQATGCRRGATLRLAKRIPMAAGLGGGSSDAAATLFGLNYLWQLGLDRVTLAGLAANLGSDVPFFFSLPAARCTGRGEVVEPATVGRPLWMVIVKPAVGLATAEVYGKVRAPEQPRDSADLLRALAAGEIGEVGRLLHNRLQPVAEQLCPVLTELRERLAALQPAGVLLSGSGTSLFALCAGPAAANRLAWTLRTDPHLSARVYVVRSFRCE